MVDITLKILNVLCKICVCVYDDRIMSRRRHNRARNWYQQRPNNDEENIEEEFEIQQISGIRRNQTLAQFE